MPQLADAAGMSRQHVARVRRGEASTTIKHARQLARGASILCHRRVNLDELFDVSIEYNEPLSGKASPAMRLADINTARAGTITHPTTDDQVAAILNRLPAGEAAAVAAHNASCASCAAVAGVAASTAQMHRDHPEIMRRLFDTLDSMPPDEQAAFVGSLIECAKGDDE